MGYSSQNRHRVPSDNCCKFRSHMIQLDIPLMIQSALMIDESMREPMGRKLWRPRWRHMIPDDTESTHLRLWQIIPIKN